MSAPAGLRRLRALLRPPRRIEGFVDGCVAGEIRGWALAPGEPGRRVHVLALCEGQVVAEALADLSRADLLRDGRGDGRHGFRLRLPAALLDGTPRTVRVEAVAAGARERLLRSEVEVRAPEAVQEPIRPAPGPAEGRARALGQGRAALVIWGEDEAAAARTKASWDRQDWPDRASLRLAGPDADEAQLRTLFQEAHTLLFARAGDALDPAAARLLVQARPLGDVVVWGGRPEARALGVLLGESLGGALAVRGHALGGYPGQWSEALRSPGQRRLELWLASRPELRWASLAAPISARGDAFASPPLRREDVEGLAGLAWRDAEGGRAGRLVPDAPAGRITLAAWPAGAAAAQASLASLLAQAPADAGIELLAAPQDLQSLRGLVDGRDISIRPVDTPERAGAGAWLRALGEAATGEAIVMARADVRLATTAARAIEELAAWCLAPLTGAASVRLQTPAGDLGGLGLARGPEGWRTGPAQGEGARPVLAAPAAFLAVSRARLAAVGGVDELRFPDRAADLDLGLRLRRAGWSSLVLGDLVATCGEAAALAEGPDLAALDPAELAAAALAFPAGDHL